jgi:all-trans-8'-apo-beta-carotenal 15,15'-oxygenase
VRNMGTLRCPGKATECSGPRRTHSRYSSILDQYTHFYRYQRNIDATKQRENQSRCRASKLLSVDEQYIPFLDSWDTTFIDTEEDVEGYFCEIEGDLPKELRGTLFRNGSNRFESGEYKVDHPYDGDGFIASLAIKEGKAYFRSRFVQTFEYQAEKEAGRVLFRGTFATQRATSNFGDLYVKNPSNTNVMYYKGNFWSLFEAGQPYRICPYTLQTIGIDTLGGLIKTGLPFDLGSNISNKMMGSMVAAAQKYFSGEEYFQVHGIPEDMVAAGGHAVTAHPHIIDGTLCTFSYQMKMGIIDPTQISFPPLYTEVRFMEFEDENMELKRTRTISIPGFAFLHDFAITESHYILMKNPVTVDNATYMSGKAPAASCVRWQENKPTILYMIPRQGSDDIKTFELPSSFIFHHANAYEDGNDVIVDSIHYPSLPAVGKEALPSQCIDPNAAFQSRLRRVRVNNFDSVEKASISIETLSSNYLEMPSVRGSCRGSKHRYVYGYESDFSKALIGVSKIDTVGRNTQTWFPEPHEFLLEPHFIGRDADQREDDDNGWVLAQFFDSKTSRSGFFLFDARHLDQGPLCKIWLEKDKPLPSGLHGCWTYDYLSSQ